MRANCNNQEADNSFLYESAAATWRAIECVGWNFGKKRLTVRRVAGQSTEYHQHVVDVKLSHYLVRLVLSGRHRLRYNGICCFEWCAGTALAKKLYAPRKHKRNSVTTSTVQKEASNLKKLPVPLLIYACCSTCCCQREWCDWPWRWSGNRNPTKTLLSNSANKSTVKEPNENEH